MKLCASQRLLSFSAPNPHPPCLVCNRWPINHRTEYCNSQACRDRELAEAQGDHMALLKVTRGYELAQACLGQGDC